MVAGELAELRAEVAALRNELLEKVGGQLRLERIETTRLIGSDLEALQHEVRSSSLLATASTRRARVADRAEPVAGRVPDRIVEPRPRPMAPSRAATPVDRPVEHRGRSLGRRPGHRPVAAVTADRAGGHSETAADADGARSDPGPAGRSRSIGGRPGLRPAVPTACGRARAGARQPSRDPSRCRPSQPAPHRRRPAGPGRRRRPAAVRRRPIRSPTCRAAALRRLHRRRGPDRCRPSRRSTPAAAPAARRPTTSAAAPPGPPRPRRPSDAGAGRRRRATPARQTTCWPACSPANRPPSPLRARAQATTRVEHRRPTARRSGDGARRRR